MNETISLVGEIKDLMVVPWVFQALHAGKKTGTLVFENDEFTKKVYLASGDIVFASSNSPEDRLSEWLVRSGIITREQSDATTERFKKTGKREGELLLEQGFLSAENLSHAIKSQIKQIIVSLCGWREGRYAFDESPLPFSEIIELRISTANLIIEGLREIDWKIIRKSLPPLRTILRPSSDPVRLFQGADLDADQREVFSLIDGSKSMEEICGLSGIGDYNTLKAVYVLLALRMVEAGELKDKEEKEFVRNVVRETVVVKEEKAAKEEPLRTMTKEELRAAHETLDRQDYYEMLGVARTATPPEMKKAYFTLAKLYHPDRHFQAEMKEMKQTLEMLFSTIHDAYETLADQTKRAAYDLALAKRQATSRAEEQAKASTASNKDNAEAQYHEGLKRLKVGNFWGAEEAFRWAIRLEPENAEYVFRLAQALSRIPRRSHDAEEQYRKAVKLAPKRVEFSVELGAFYERLGLKTKARATYQEGLKHDPSSAQLKEAVAKLGGE